MILLDLLTEGNLSKEKWQTQNNLLREQLATFQSRELKLN